MRRPPPVCAAPWRSSLILLKPTTHLGTVLSRLEQLDAAEASLRRALSIEPESAEILHDLATDSSVTSASPRKQCS